MKTILIVDSDQNLADNLSEEFVESRMLAQQVFDGVSGVECTNLSSPDLVLVEFVLPDISGIEVLRRLKRSDRTRKIPIVFVSKMQTEMNKIVAFELGATDYIAKPFNIRELVLRVRAILRRTTPMANHDVVKMGSIKIDVAHHTLTADGHDISLTQREFRILLTLIQAKGQVLTRDQILDASWEGNADIHDRTVDAHIKTIRSKLGSAAGHLKTINRVGYCLRRGTDNMSPLAFRECPNFKRQKDNR